MIAHPRSAPPELPDLDEPAIPQGAEPESAIHGPIAGRYDLGDRIARGGMGIVYKAHDRLLNRTVAVKVVRSRFMDRPDLLRRFLTEARISGKLQHPGIVPVYEYGSLADTRPFIAMKLIEGKTLSRELKERKTPADNLAHFLKVFETLCQTMAYAHRQGVIHRDLKPDNVMVGEFGEVQVMDWGLAKFLNPADAVALTPDGFEAVEKSVYLSGDGTTPAGEYPTEATAIRAVGPDEVGAGYTTAGEVFGTLPYMPPEQARGETDRVDRRGDVFALGAILCQILTGQPPYFGAPEALRDQARGGKLFGAYVLLDRCGVDQALVLLAKHCLAVDPEARPADATSLAAMVTQCLEGLQDRTRQLEISRMQAEARLAEAEAREKLARKARHLARMLAVAGVLVAGSLAAWIGYFTRHPKMIVADFRPGETVVQQADSRPEPQPQPEAGPQPPTPAPVATVEPPPVPTPSPVPSEVKPPQPGPDDLLKRGLALADAGQTDDALAALRAAVQADPKLVAAHVRIGELLLAKGKADDARDSFNAAIEIEPTNGRAQVGLAKAELARGDLDGAAIAYKAAISLPGYAAAAHAGLGQIHLKRWEASKAVAQFRSAVEGEPKNPTYRLGLVEALRVANDTAGAIREAKAAATTIPKSAAAHRVLGDLLDRSGDRQGAADAYKAVVECEPTDADARQRLAALYEGLNDPTAAAVQYQAVADLRPKDAKPLESLARVWEKAGEFAKAVEGYRKAVAIDPADATTRRHLGRCLARTGDEAGLTELRTAADALPDSGDVRVDLGNAYWELGQFRHAATAYREAAAKFPADSPQADAALTAKRHATRLAGLEDRLAEITSGAVTFTTPAAWADVGEMCLRTKRFAAAARFYGEAAEGDSKYAAAAATCAALAGFGRGVDAESLSEDARLEWRKTALAAFRQTAAWAKDPALAGLHDPTVMEDLSDKEREAWKAVWDK